MFHFRRWERRLLSAALLMLLVAPASARQCELSRISIDPVSAASREHFVGSGKNVELDFINESTTDPVEVFPEPPLTVRQKATGAKCEIDGGIWVRNAVYLSGDEKLLVTQEYSGSNDQLVFYDTANCKKKARLDVSGALWQISAAEVAIGRSCKDKDFNTCRKVRRYVLDAQCQPKPAGRK